MKKSMAFVLTIMLLMTALLAGCGSQKESAPAQNVENNLQEPEQESAVEEKAEAEETAGDDAESAAKEAEEAPAEEEAEPEQEPEPVPEAPQEETVIDRSEVFEMFADMTSGWNLGNTFDAHGAGNSNAAETYWGNPKTTQEMIDAVVDKGFNVIRIPVTWAEHVGSAPDYKINPDWMNRVEEVVNYALSRGAYVIIDTHHEPDFWMTTNPAVAENVKAELVAIWKQVAEHFKDYDEKLLFEGMNEPRLKGSEKEWSGGTSEERVLINEWNQAFVDTVRSSGGNNATRCLIICPYGTSANMNALKELEIPADNHIAVAVHMYTPYEFTYVQSNPGADISVWNGTGKTGIANTVNYLKQNFLSKDVPVIVTEYGAENKNNREEIDKWVADYLQIMTTAGIRCIWWDNGIYNTSGEKFSIFNRRDCTWFAESTADAIIKAATAKE